MSAAECHVDRVISSQSQQCARSAARDVRRASIHDRPGMESISGGQATTVPGRHAPRAATQAVGPSAPTRGETEGRRAPPVRPVRISRTRYASLGELLTGEGTFGSASDDEASSCTRWLAPDGDGRPTMALTAASSDPSPFGPHPLAPGTENVSSPWTAPATTIVNRGPFGLGVPSGLKRPAIPHRVRQVGVRRDAGRSGPDPSR